MSETLRRGFILLALTAAAMAALLAFFPAAGHDQIWFLLMARRWLGGATLYGPEIFDSNPPMIVWVSAIPVHMASLLRLPATTVAKALVLLAAGSIASLSGRLLSRVWRPIDPSERPALAFAFIVLFLVVPARDLGQRDALAGLLVLPYVLYAAGRPGPQVPPPLRVAAVLLACMGFCLKPQDALIAIALEPATLALAHRRTGSWTAAFRTWLPRPEPYLLLAGGAVYLAGIHHFAPLYFTKALPILRNTYWAIGHLSLLALLWQAVQLVALAATTILLARRTRASSAAAFLLTAAGLGAFAAYLIQGTGWYYQQLPAIDLFGTALVLQLLDLHRAHPVQLPPWTAPALGGVCLLAIALTTHFTNYPFTADRAFALTSPDPALFRQLPPGTPVAILTTSVDEAMMPIERYHLSWAQRTNNLWLLPAILRTESPGPSPVSRRLPLDTLHSLDTLQHRWMVEDLTRWRPALILVERCQDPTVNCQELEDRHDDLLAWFQRDPAFAALLQHYRFAGTRDRFDAFVLR